MTTLKSRIQRGSGVYTCSCCGRSTRDTGRGEGSCENICWHCYEAGGIENQMSDEGETPELLAEWQGLIDACIAAGGNPTQTKWWR